MSDFTPYAADLSLEAISKMVRARREWWAKRKLSRASNGQHRVLQSVGPTYRGHEHRAGITFGATAQGVHSNERSGVGVQMCGGSILSREVEAWNAEGAAMFGGAPADAARPASLSPASHRASAPRAGTNHARCACGG